MKDLLQRLLCKDPGARLGCEGGGEIRSHGWFFGVNWEALLKEEVKAPSVPEMKGDADTHWFEGEEHELTPPDDSSVSEKSQQEKYQEFSLSWKSSNEMERGEQEEARSPPEIVINITEINQE